MLAMAPAVIAGCRVTELVTPVASPSFDDPIAAAARDTYEAPERFCESTTNMPCLLTAPPLPDDKGRPQW